MSSRDSSPSSRGTPRKVLLGPPPQQGSSSSNSNKRPLLQSPPYKRPLIADRPGWPNRDRDEPPAKRPPLLPTPFTFQPPPRPPTQQAPPLPPPPPPLPPMPLMPPPQRATQGLLPHPNRRPLLPSPGEKRPLLQIPPRFREPNMQKQGGPPPRRSRSQPGSPKRPLLPTPRIKC
ncbi:basic proline-rich protein-like [Neocloeon triangulifer]|uniref:basic proline-rich protein-like n=1 Tax=Neocloeon triangulifer TaxID=2078957 RepID=UPI00286F5002|nr:basic proline-rich protein-like [Neocloeon triangulifer]